MKTNFMFDVAFTVEGPWEYPEEVPSFALIFGLQTRLTELMEANLIRSQDVTEAFGFCDSYAVKEFSTSAELLKASE